MTGLRRNVCMASWKVVKPVSENDQLIKPILKGTKRNILFTSETAPMVIVLKTISSRARMDLTLGDPEFGNQKTTMAHP